MIYPSGTLLSYVALTQFVKTWLLIQQLGAVTNFQFDYGVVAVPEASTGFLLVVGIAALCSAQLLKRRQKERSSSGLRASVPVGRPLPVVGQESAIRCVARIIDRKLTYRAENINHFDVDEILGSHRGALFTRKCRPYGIGRRSRHRGLKVAEALAEHDTSRTAASDGGPTMPAETTASRSRRLCGSLRGPALLPSRAAVPGSGTSETAMPSWRP